MGQIVFVRAIKAPPKHTMYVAPQEHSALQVKGGERPPARYGHATCVIREKVFMFGGVGTDGALLADLWILDQDTTTWACATCYGAPPSPRRGACVRACVFCARSASPGAVANGLGACSAGG
jgi:hypothetical protein